MRVYFYIKLVSLTLSFYFTCCGYSGLAQATLAPNLIRNSYFNLVGTDGKPHGFSVVGNVQIQAVHPFTKGFEGPYAPNPPASVSTTINGASETSPFYFGIYNMGPRMVRGGLSTGWGSKPDGRILKITGDNLSAASQIGFPMEENVKTSKVRFRCWIKIVTGERVGFGVDAGYDNSNWLAEKVITKATTDAATNGWYFIDEIVNTSNVTSLAGNAFLMSVKGGSARSTPFEVYIALPYINLFENNDWLPSVSDMLSRDGITINPANANVGIGTTNPQNRLSLIGLGGGNIDFSMTGRMEIKSTTPGIWFNNASAANFAFIGCDPTNVPNQAFGIFLPNTIGWKAFYLANNGNIGIGTSAPSERLSVNGNIVAQKVRVTQTGWPDYVFQDNYPLLPLSNLQAFIQKNKHLPEVPSEKQVSENGLDLGDMNAVLLKKIEELTLYIIDLQQQVNALKQKPTSTINSKN